MSETLRILMVEDQEVDAILIQRELRRQGLTFTVRRVDRDDAMIQALREFMPDLVLSDFGLPGFGGLEALAILRKERPGVPLIFVSGTIGEEQAVELLEMGATDYVLKNNLARLPASINRALREARLARECRVAEEPYRETGAGKKPRATPAGQPLHSTSPAAAVAHDLNNILAPIPMAVSMLRTGPPEAERDRLLAIIENSAKRASEIVRSSLLPGHGGEEERRPLEMGRVLKEVFQKLQPTWPENMRVKLTVEDDLWRVVGDARQIEQVIRNLCVNARTAMPDGGTLRLSVGDRKVDAGSPFFPPGVKPGDFVVLEVSDTGKGLTPEGAPRFLDPVRGAALGDRPAASGLAAARDIVKNHGGFVQTISVQGEGTTFRAYLPAMREPVTAVDPAPLQSAGGFPGSGACVLLVDDEETIRFAAKAVLAKHGYRVLAASDGAAALSLFKAHGGEISLVITDVMMPVMGGLELVRAVRQVYPAVPIIASSGQNEKTRLAELQAAGVNGFLDKPYAADILLRAVADVLLQHPSR